jgi:branched-chain amino acid transport system permease protein
MEKMNENKWKPPILYAFLVVVTVVVLALPLITNIYILNIMNIFMMFSVLAVSVNFLAGYAGQVSIGHNAFWALGAYTYALLTTGGGWPTWLALLCGIIVAALVSIPLGILSLRLKGPYFAILTLGFGIAVTNILFAWSSLTKGGLGISGVPVLKGFPLPWGVVNFGDRRIFFYLALLILVLSVISTYKLSHSLWGLRFIALRENEELGRSVGINMTKVKISALFLSAVIAGLGGVLYASYLRCVAPEISAFFYGFESIAQAALGGLGTTAGPLIGCGILTLLPEVLEVEETIRLTLSGIILMVIIIAMPHGLVPAFVKLYRRFTKGRESK